MTAVIRTLNRLRIVGALEGISYLVLLGVAMPLKYLAGRPEAVAVVGWVHGALFLAFIATLAHAAFARRWPIFRIGAAFLSSLIPFGTFVLDGHLRAEARQLGKEPQVGSVPPVALKPDIASEIS